MAYRLQENKGENNSYQRTGSSTNNSNPTSNRSSSSSGGKRSYGGQDGTSNSSKRVKQTNGIQQNNSGDSDIAVAAALFASNADFFIMPVIPSTRGASHFHLPLESSYIRSPPTSTTANRPSLVQTEISSYMRRVPRLQHASFITEVNDPNDNRIVQVSSVVSVVNSGQLLWACSLINDSSSEITNVDALIDTGASVVLKRNTLPNTFNFHDFVYRSRFLLRQLQELENN